jgi:hypothetical protein
MAVADAVGGSDADTGAGDGPPDYQRVPDGQGGQGESARAAAGRGDASAVGRSDAMRGGGGGVEVDEEQPLLTDGGAGSDQEVRAKVARGAEGAGRRGVSVSVPGCCTIELGGEELLLECTDYTHLHVWAVRGGAEVATGRLAPLCTLAKAGHFIQSFVKLQGRDCIVTGGDDGKVRWPTPIPQTSAPPSVHRHRSRVSERYLVSPSYSRTEL